MWFQLLLCVSPALVLWFQTLLCIFFLNLKIGPHLLSCVILNFFPLVSTSTSFSFPSFLCYMMVQREKERSWRRRKRKRKRTPIEVNFYIHSLLSPLIETYKLLSSSIIKSLSAAYIEADRRSEHLPTPYIAIKGIIEILWTLLKFTLKLKDIFII